MNKILIFDLKLKVAECSEWRLVSPPNQQPNVQLHANIKQTQNIRGRNVKLSFSLFILQPLDFEKKRQYSLKVQVENLHINPRFFSVGLFRDEAVIKIVVEDVDEPPAFERPSYVMEVKEDAAKSTVIGSVSASDPDDKSSLVRY